MQRGSLNLNKVFKKFDKIVRVAKKHSTQNSADMNGRPLQVAHQPFKWNILRDINTFDEV